VIKDIIVDLSNDFEEHVVFVSNETKDSFINLVNILQAAIDEFLNTVKQSKIKFNTF
jgi:hypothetical protein